MKRLYQADFIRVVSTLGIILFHFSSEMAFREISGPRPLYYTANFSYGSLFVTVFFLLSGGMVHYSFQNKRYSVIQYFKKRFLSIFPAFYFVFLFLYAKAVWENGSFFYKGHPASLLLSMIGMDGYFSYRFTTYYQIGEWFLGALILLYLIYPLLNLCAKYQKFLTTVFILAAYIGVLLSGDFYKINDFENFFSCLISFWAGILLIQYREVFLDKAATGWISTGLLLILLWIKIPLNENLLVHAAGILCFCALYAVSSCTMKPDFVKKAVCFLSAISYPVYLIHHVLLSFCMNRLPGGQWTIGQTILFLIGMVLLILLLGYIIYVMVNQAFRVVNYLTEKNFRKE